jgi:hypothetical protein
MALLHHLARTGGTLISRCLASMQGICLLSEINPLGTAHFNPLKQAARWYGLIAEHEMDGLELDSEEQFRAAMELIHTRAQEQGLTLVVRTDNLFQLSLLLAGVGEVEESLTYSRYLLSVDRQHLGAAANFLLYLNYSDRRSAAEVSNEHFRLGMRFTDRPEHVSGRRLGPAEKIRVGYLSSDFYTHPVGKIILPILQAHDRNHFYVKAYYDGKTVDTNTTIIEKAVDDFTKINDWTDQQVLESIRGDELDVLIDLGGYTGGGNRLRVFSRRAVPIQASFLGYPNTSAIQTIDYHLTDRFADPPVLTEHLYGEQLVWLDHAHLAWRPYEIVDQIELRPEIRGRFFDGPLTDPVGLTRELESIFADWTALRRCR